MKADNNLVGVLMMIKNEENSIAITINSIKDYSTNFFFILFKSFYYPTILEDKYIYSQ